MGNLRIPERYKSGLEKLRSLSDGTFQSLLAALEKCPPMIRVEDIAGHVAPSVPEIPQDDIEKVLRSICSICFVRIDVGIPAQRIASDVYDAMPSRADEELKPSELRRQSLQERLEKLLELEPLSYAAKAMGLSGQFLCLFCDAKILTDLRPIFGKPEEEPVGAVITHTLKLGYHEHGDHKELYIALDPEDIATLKKVLERAESKAMSLGALVRKIGMPDPGVQS